MHPYINYSTPPNSFSISQASFASCPFTLSTHLAIIRLQVSPTPTCQTPGCLSCLIKRLDTSNDKTSEDALGCEFICDNWVAVGVVEVSDVGHLAG